MPWWFYLTPFGWLNLYLTLVLLTHETGHLIAAYLTGHKITGFQIGLSKPIVQFLFRGILFEFSLGANGGYVHTDVSQRVSQIGILLTAISGPFLELSLATAILALACQTELMWPQTILMSLSFITYWTGFEGLARDLKNILKTKPE